MAPARILIVEDETIVAMDIAATLRRLGYEVVGMVGSGAAAIESAQSMSPHLILMDIRIKGPMDGIEAASLIQQQGMTPIVFLTAHADADTVERAKAASPYGYLVKPFDERALHRALEIALQRAATDKAVQGKALDALWKSEERSDRLAAIVESSNDAIIGKDLSGIITSWNCGAEKIFGYTAREMLGTPTIQLIPASLRHEEDRILEIIKRGETVDQMETKRQTKDGRIIDISATASPIKDAQGKVVGASKIARDITQRKEHEREIDRLSRLYAALSGVDQAIVQIATRDELFHKVCQVLVEQGGFRVAWIGWHDPQTHRLMPVAVCGQELAEVQRVEVYADDRAVGRGPTGMAFLTRRPYISNDLVNDPATLPWKKDLERSGFRSSAALPVRINSEVCGTISVYSLELDYFQDKEVALLVEAATDISFALDNFARESSRQEAERSLRENEARYRTLFDYAPDGIVIADPESYYLDANASMCRMLGYTREEFIGLHASDIVVQSEIKHIGEALEVISATTDYRREWKFRRKDGSAFAAEVIATTMPDGNLLGMIRDVTDERSLQAQLVQAQKLDSLGQLAGGIAHDFNNMLMVIFARCEILLRQLESEKHRHFVNDIYAAASKNRALTQQLLAAARKQVLEPQVMNVNDVIRSTMKLLAPTLGEQIKIRTEIDESLWNVYADPGKLHQVLLNLAINARDAMPRGGTLTVESRNIRVDAAYARQHINLHEGDYVSLVVTDSGSGIPKEIRERIYDPFFTTKEAGRGTGLGLAVVRGIVEQTGGRMWMYSEEGRGTAFKFLLPRHLGGVKRDIVPEEAMPERGDETILLVEDEELLRCVVHETLEEQGYLVLEAGTPAQALTLNEDFKERIHLLLTDVIMPGMTGKELSELIAATRSELAVIFMSGYTSNAVINHADLPQTVRYLEKPIPTPLLLRTIRIALDSAKE
jgi:two-component system cell cycle sensor histidine kinase/response regulator CckA